MKHGSLDFEELERLGLHPTSVMDFSANLNPYGPHEAVRAAVARTALDRYPDRQCIDLARALEAFLDVSRNQMLCGNGSSELIWLTALAFVRAGDRVLVVGPTYSEYARAAKLMGARVTIYRAREDADFIADSGAIGTYCKRHCPRVVFVCNPNNPTGSALKPEVIGDWAKKCPRTLFVVDEAYLAFAAGLGSVLDCAMDNMLVLRSMTKDYCLAGLRLGYAVGATRLIAALRRAQPPWSVNALAQAAGVAALRHVGHQQRSLQLLAMAKQDLVIQLTRLGLRPVRSAVHFFLLPCPKSFADGAAFREALLSRSVVVRECASFGLPDHVRIGTRNPEDNQRLLAAIREVT
jgi:histidinol-phosphate aminotransferase